MIEWIKIDLGNVETIPDSNRIVVTKSPEEHFDIASWRQAYDIFTCQSKSESSQDWEWVYLD